MGNHEGTTACVSGEVRKAVRISMMGSDLATKPARYVTVSTKSWFVHLCRVVSLVCLLAAMTFGTPYVGPNVRGWSPKWAPEPGSQAKVSSPLLPTQI